MSTMLIRRALLLLTGVLLVAVCFAGAAVANPSSTCQTRPGVTIVESTAVRVFVRHQRYYACLRAGGRVHWLDDGFRYGDGTPVLHRIDPRIVGRFVAWREANGGFVLDVTRGTTRSFGDIVDTVGEFNGYVLNTRGTVVWLTSYNHMCQARSTLSESTARGTVKVLDSGVNHGGSPDRGCTPGLTEPIKTLGLSVDGHFAYWQYNGAFRGTAIP